jgi:poly(3-hydroxyoctanoate) depolymerase
VLFLPGARGDGAYWRPVAGRLPAHYERVFLDWPGLGDVPADRRVRSFDGLLALVTKRMEEPVDLVAQSMGGVVAVRAALDRPDRVRRLVLAATSGGVDLAPFNVEDWRPAYREAYPSAPAWLLEYRADLSARIPEIRTPTLLLWGDSDPISPVGIGEYLGSLLPRSKLVVIPGGSHTFAEDQPAEVAPHIAAHLAVEMP